MRTIDILGDNRSENFGKIRTACRGIVTDNGRLLASRAENTDTWMLPGGGTEPGETAEECCVRELREETGCIVRPLREFLVINEFYEDCKFISRYFVCEIAGRTSPVLTETERKQGLQPVWVDPQDFLAVTAKHRDYAAADEEKRGIYLREHTALREYLLSETLRTTLETRIKAKRQILFGKDDGCIEELAQLIASESRRTVILWALELAEETVQLLERKYPGDDRARDALELTKAWAEGKIKMPLAKQAILRCHAAAKELDSPEDIALCHAVGQACAAVHAPGHAIGYPIYALTALVRKYGIDEGEMQVRQALAYYRERLLYRAEHSSDPERNWANFILDADCAVT